MNSWIKFVIVFFSLFVGVSLFPCGELPDPYDHDFFIKEVILQNSEEDDLDTYDSTNLFKEQNIVEWNIFFEKQVDWVAISFWLYESKLSDIDEILFYLENKTPITTENVKVNGKSFFKYPKKSKAFFYYLGFARRNEVFENASWIEPAYNLESIPKKSIINLPNQIEGGISLYKNEAFQFIKERYIFQIVRLYYNNSEYKKSIQFYEKNKSELKFTESMKWRTIGYVAGSYSNQDKNGEANYLYSLIYMHLPKLKYRAYISFYPKDDKDWQESLKLAKNKEEKIVLWYLFGKRYDPALAMKEILNLDTDSMYLKLLLISTIKSKSYSVFENGIQYYLYDDPNYRKVIPLNDKALITTVNSIANQEKVKNKFGWTIAAAYLNYLSLNFKEEDQFLESAFKLKGNVEVFEKQYQITSLLGKLLRIETIDNKSEMTILPEMKFLFSKDKNISEDLNLKFPRQWVRDLLAVWYARKGELEKAEWIHSGIIRNHFRNLENAKKMVDFIEDNNHSPLLRVMLENPIHSYDDYLLLLGIRYAQVEDLENSLKTFEKNKESYWNYKDRDYSHHPFINNPFFIEVKDRFYKKSNEKMISKYNHKTLLQEMIRLKKEAEANPSKSSKKYFKLANAFYNMNYFGTSGFHINPIHQYNYGFSWRQLYFFSDEKKEFYPELSSSLAMKYYLLARENSKSKNFKAKMTFMMAKCEQNAWYLTKDFKSSVSYWHYEKNEMKDFQPGKYFQELRDIYSDTKYHSEIIKECSYYARYYEKK